MPPFSKLTTLKCLCIQVISLDISQHKNQIPLIQNLPTILLDDIHTHLLKYSDVQEHTCVERLGCKLSRMTFSMRRWARAQRRVPPNLQPPNVHLFQRCQNLTDIDLSTNLFRNNEWEMIFSTINRVHKLDVSETNITDECLGVLGDCSPDLQDLNLSDCEEITDAAMLHLIHCRSDGEWTCAKLALLDIINTAVDNPEGAHHVLQYAKSLWYLHGPDLYPLIRHLSEQSKQSQPASIPFCLTSFAPCHDSEQTIRWTDTLTTCAHFTELKICSERLKAKLNSNYERHDPEVRRVLVYAEVNDDISSYDILLHAVTGLAPILTSLELQYIPDLC